MLTDDFCIMRVGAKFAPKDGCNRGHDSQKRIATADPIILRLSISLDIPVHRHNERPAKHGSWIGS